MIMVEVPMRKNHILPETEGLFITDWFSGQFRFAVEEQRDVITVITLRSYL